jgi:hypothetical protein
MGSRETENSEVPMVWTGDIATRKQGVGDSNGTFPSRMGACSAYEWGTPFDMVNP